MPALFMPQCFHIPKPFDYLCKKNEITGSLHKTHRNSVRTHQQHMKQLSNTLTATLAKLHINSLNPMQEAALNPSIAHKDIILLSPTGTGKTLAFLLPLSERLQADTNRLQALILAPSRELAMQIDTVFKAMSTPHRSVCCYGGHSVSEEKRNLQNVTPAVIIGTPGRIADHLRRGNISPTDIETLIIDEFDKSLELGFEEEMAEIISQLTKLTKRMLISATDMPQIPPFTGLTNPAKLNFLIAPHEEHRLRLLKVLSPEKDKIDTLFALLCSLGTRQGIVFCNHRESVERVHKLLTDKGILCEMFHGGMEQPDRERALMKFRNGSSPTLISTDLGSRGLDIPEVAYIIHYHLPTTDEAFAHRNGRTTRWNTTGDSFLILHPTETIPAYLPEIENAPPLPTHPTLPPKPAWVTLYIGKGKKDKLSKIDVVGFLSKKGMLARTDLGMVEIKEHQSFAAVKRAKVKQLLALVAGEKIKGLKTIIKEVR